MCPSLNKYAWKTWLSFFSTAYSATAFVCYLLISSECVQLQAELDFVVRHELQNISARHAELHDENRELWVFNIYALRQLRMRCIESNGEKLWLHDEIFSVAHHRRFSFPVGPSHPSGRGQNWATTTGLGQKRNGRLHASLLNRLVYTKSCNHKQINTWLWKI